MRHKNGIGPKKCELILSGSRFELLWSTCKFSHPMCLLQSFMNGSLFDFYIFHLYFEQILMDEDQMETRLRLHRTITTPLLPRLLFIENRKSNYKAFDKLLQQ